MVEGMMMLALGIIIGVALAWLIEDIRSGKQ